MFPSTSSRETLRLSGKQNSLFPSGAHIKCILYFVYTCIQQSFQNDLKECNMTNLHSSSGYSSSCVYIKMDDDAS